MTPSRQKINVEFGRWFEHFATHHAVYFVTGSDRNKTMQQLGPSIYNLAIRSYQCNGNDVWQQNKNIRTSKLDIPNELKQDLKRELESSKFSVKTGFHIEERPGLVNFSIPGRNADIKTRALYKQWDEETNERKLIAARLKTNWPNYTFGVAGETGIDITTEHCDKSQILKDFNNTDTIYFFGDKIQYGGNDHEIALAVHDRTGGDHFSENNSRVFEVTCWNDTWNILKQMVND